MMQAFSITPGELALAKDVNAQQRALQAIEAVRTYVENLMRQHIKDLKSGIVNKSGEFAINVAPVVTGNSSSHPSAVRLVADELVALGFEAEFKHEADSHDNWGGDRFWITIKY